jgi:hypothetical protein
MWRLIWSPLRPLRLALEPSLRPVRHRADHEPVAIRAPHHPSETVEQADAHDQLYDAHERPHRVVAVHRDEPGIHTILWLDVRGDAWTTRICFLKASVVVGRRRAGFCA